MYNHNKAQQSKNRVHISWDIRYAFLYAYSYKAPRISLWFTETYLHCTILQAVIFVFGTICEFSSSKTTLLVIISQHNAYIALHHSCREIYERHR